MEQISNEITFSFSGKAIYNILADLKYISIRYGGYKTHRLVAESETSRELEIEIDGFDNKSYSWNVIEHCNKDELTVISEKTSQLAQFKCFSSIYRVNCISANSCLLTNIKAFELDENSGYQVDQVSPSLKMIAKMNMEQVKHGIEEILKP